MIVHALYDGIEVTIPPTAYTLDGFRQWARSDAYPERGKITYTCGDVIVDMSPERSETHNQVKSEINGVLGPMIKRLDLGRYMPDGMWITNDEADLSNEPDAVFASWETLESGRAVLSSDELELIGTPDWVLEIVSKSSVRKDTKILVDRYHRGGIREYWIIDARGDDLQFTVLQHEEQGYVAAPAADGWTASRVFAREFRLDRQRDRVGGWQYTLHVRKD